MGYVTKVVVKDMSHLYRDYLQVGCYTDTFFPDRNIRFIAVNDCLDSNDGENKPAPFRNVMNEMYARDISRKVRNSHQLRGNAGEPLCQPPYGYLKSPENKKKWIIDSYAAQIVNDIFRMCLEGKGNKTITRILQENKVLVPMEYWHEKGLAEAVRKHNLILTNGANRRLPRFLHNRNTAVISSISKPIPNSLRTRLAFRTQRITG